MREPEYDAHKQGLKHCPQEGPMKSIFKMSLGVKLVVSFLLISMVPMGAVGYLSFSAARAQVEKDVFDKVHGANEMRRIQVRDFLAERLHDAGSVARLPVPRQTVSRFAAYHKLMAVGDGAPFDIASAEYEELHSFASGAFDVFLGEEGMFQDILLVCAEHGHVMYSHARESDLGANLRTGDLKDSGLARLWRRVVESHRPTVEDFSFYGPSGRAVAFIGVPMTDESGRTVAILAAQIASGQINSLLSGTAGMGETGETHLVGPDLLMRNVARHSDNDAILKEKVDMEPVREALAGRDGTMLATDHRGKQVLVAYEPVGMADIAGADFEWALTSQIEADEAFAATNALMRDTLLLMLAAAAAALVLALFLGKQISGPLLRLSGQVSTASSQLLAATTELSIGATEAVTAVTQTMSTSKEIQQTARLSAEKSQQVSDQAQEVARVTVAGTGAVAETRRGMDRIRELSDAVSKAIMKLSEQSRSIGQIVGAVENLAEQSNLLAVNAAIEAAKSGEHGKGFGVVAQEIRKLAEESGDFTEQIRQILTDVQQSTTESVLATEQVIKAVLRGVELAATSGDAIQQLGDSVSLAARRPRRSQPRPNSSRWVLTRFPMRWRASEKRASRMPPAPDRSRLLRATWPWSAPS
jgi:methyl-accepting chemotaxis protein